MDPCKYGKIKRLGFKSNTCRKVVDKQQVRQYNPILRMEKKYERYLARCSSSNIPLGLVVKVTNEEGTQIDSMAEDQCYSKRRNA